MEDSSYNSGTSNMVEETFESIGTNNNTNLDSSLSDDMDAKQKANRFFAPNAIDILKRWFDDNLDYPYPDENTTSMLACEANISTKQVRKWFANKRVRSNKCYKQIYRTKKKSITQLDSSDGDVKEESSSVTTSINESINTQDDIIQEQQPQQTSNINSDMTTAAAIAAFYNPMILINYLQNNPSLLFGTTHQNNQHGVGLLTPESSPTQHQEQPMKLTNKKMRINFGNISELIY